MKRYAWTAIGALALAACSDGYDPTSLTPSFTIDMPGNVSECGTIDFGSCYAKVDNQFKLIYERNNTYSRQGEATYNSASNSNNELAEIFNTPSTTVDDALSQLDRFISQIQTALNTGKYSACAANSLLERATWLRAKIAAGDADMSDAPAFACSTSPVASVSATGTMSAGVTLTINDPWHYTQDKYNTGLYHTVVYFEIAGPGGIATTEPAEQTGAATVTYTDPLTTLPGTYTYSVKQCDVLGYIGCSAAVSTTVTIIDTTPPDDGGDDPGDGGDDPGDGGDDPGDIGACPHDNRNGLKSLVVKTKPKCEKDDKQEKIHKN